MASNKEHKLFSPFMKIKSNYDHLYVPFNFNWYILFFRRIEKRKNFLKLERVVVYGYCNTKKVLFHFQLKRQNLANVLEISMLF